MNKSDTFILKEHLDKMANRSDCILCQRDLALVKLEDRGIFEFMDGWFWICPECRPLVIAFDETQSEPWWDTLIPPYYAKSRKRWLAYLEKEYGIKIIQQK